MEPYSPWRNNAERENKIVKKLGCYFMQSTNTYSVLWSLAYTFVAEIRYRIASNKPGIQGRTLFDNIYGYTPDILQYISILWYQWIWFWKSAKVQSQQLGK